MDPPSPLVAYGEKPLPTCLHLIAPPLTGATPETAGPGQPVVAVSPPPSKKNCARTQELPAQVGLVVSINVTIGPPGPGVSPLVTMSLLCSGSNDGSSARKSPQVTSVRPLRLQVSMLVKEMPVRAVPKVCDAVPSLCATGNVSVSRLKTFTVESPSLTQRFPSLPPATVGGVTMAPLGPDTSLKLLMRSGSQQTDPTNPFFTCPMVMSLVVSKTAIAACDRSVT